MRQSVGSCPEEGRQRSQKGKKRKRSSENVVREGGAEGGAEKEVSE